jgi:hypothetical protein
MIDQSGSRRPLSVTIVALLLIVAGAVGLVYHARELDLRQPLQNDTLWVELVRALAIVSGVFMLRGHNWARWLAIVWIGFHVAISFFHSWQQVVMHAIVFAVFSLSLFRPAATAYFRSVGST